MAMNRTIRYLWDGSELFAQTADAMVSRADRGRPLISIKKRTLSHVEAGTSWQIISIPGSTQSIARYW
jgi:hypothetical protein